MDQETSYDTKAFHDVGQKTSYDTKAFRNVGQETLLALLFFQQGFFTEVIMVLYGMYFGKESLYQLIRDNGGQWNDSKERPIVCTIKSAEYEGLYWAIPVGNWNHRTEEAKIRINRYINYPDDDIRSCYYHVGNTTTKSIFFISDAIPITEKYIEREYKNRYTSQIYIIKNKHLIQELERKLKRILAYENTSRNSFRQHITDIKSILINELKS